MGARPSSFKTPVVEAKPERVWSAAQRDIFTWFETKPWSEFSRLNPPGPETPWVDYANLVVRARAGTGKTTTIIEGVNRAPEASILVCAFNKRIADELNARLDNPRAEAKTLHSLGLQMIRREWRSMPVTEKFARQENLTDRALRTFEDQSREKVPFQIRRMVTTLHTKGREMCPLDVTEDALTALAFQFDLVPDDGWRQYDLDFVVTHALLAMHDAASVQPQYDIGVDYADMIYLPLTWNLTSRDYQLVVVDEAQDMTVAQLEIAERVCDGRICVVGDDRQAIYGFRGADSNSLDRLKQKLGALELPLTTTYRCGTSIVQHAQRLVPDIAAGPDNPAGIVDACNLDELLSQVQPGDFVLSRLNAPLVSITLQLLRRRVRAQMAGRDDVATKVLAILNRLKITAATPIDAVFPKIQQWERKRTTQLASHGQIDEIEQVRDRANVLYAFAADAVTTAEMFRNLNAIFPDPNEESSAPRVWCSSIHKAKGLEAPRVFVLMDTLYRRGLTQEEANCEYVAVTRAKTHLTLVEERA